MKRTVTRFLWVLTILTTLSGFAYAQPTFQGGGSGTLTVCQNASQTSIDNLLLVNDATTGQTLTWDVNSGPTHGTLSGFPNSAPSGGFGITPGGFYYQPTNGYSGTDNFIIRVTETPSGLSATKSISVTVSPIPSAPSFANATSTVCAGNTGISYAVTAVAGTTYNWSYTGNGATILGNGTANITINYAANATSGNVNVTATNSCGTSVASTVAVTVNSAPAQPGNFTASTTPVCQGATGVVYTVPNDVNATSYNWTYSGGGATILGSGNSITINFSNAATSGTLSVTATNSCGTSSARSMAITVNSLPVAPTSFTTATTSVCQGANNVQYTVPNDPTATAYNWSYTGGGASIINSGNSAYISFSGTATSGILSVSVTNACGTSSSLSLPITVTPAPAQPGAFTISTTTVCAGATNVQYAVPTVAGATSYNWSYSGSGVSIVNSGNTAYLSFSGTATSGILSVTATNSCGTSTAQLLPITVNTAPTAATGFTASTGTVCQGQTGVVYSIANDPNATSYTWSYSGAGGTISGTGNSITMSFSNVATSGTLSVTKTNSCGTSSALTLPITVNTLPTAPTFTTATTIVCQGQSNVAYTVTNVTGATYNWAYTGTGASINGVGNSITVNYSATATSGTLTVSITNSCGTSSQTVLPITVNPLPSQPGAFTTSFATVCQGQSSVQYTVPNDPTVTSYNWSYSGTGASFSSSTNTVLINFSNTATSGTLSVTATNACGTSTARTISITVNPLPAQPAAFSVFTTPVCQGQTGVIYSVPNDPTVTSYAWTYSGTGANITPSGNSATINFTNTATSGTLSVTATNSCGTSVARTMTVVVNPLPTQPGAFSPGPASVCQGQTNVTYTVPNDPTATSYTWTYTGTGATFASTTNSVSINFSASATSGTLSVVANNACGTSSARAMAVTVNSLPATPANFTVFSATVCQGQSNVVYTVPNDPTIITYNWNYSGAGASITGTGNSVSISFSNVATSGTLSVTATSACGTSSARTMSVTVNTAPAQPGAFTAATSPVCQGATNVIYTVPNDINATSYNWSYTGTGATITGTGNSVSIDFAAGATSGTLSVSATNACGTSIVRTMTITVTPIPVQPGSFTAAPTTVCQGQSGVVYTVPNDPTVTTYNWAYTGTGATFSSSTNTVSINFSNTATGGTLSVTATNVCGTSIARTVAITVNPLPTQPLNFTTSSPTVCQGQNGVTYTVPNDPSATSYTWTYSGTGASISGTSNTAIIDFSATATNGTLSVVANNACGTSTARTLAITVNTLPSQPGAFTTFTSPVCQGQNNVSYIVPFDPTVTYTWSYSGVGATIVSANNTASVSFANNATTGTINVFATNACGNSTPRSAIVNVNPLPAQPAAFTTASTVVCQGANNVVYTVPNDPTVTYTWSYTGTGAAITGTGNSVLVSFSATATSGSLNVVANNACGTSSARTIAITVSSLPAQPANFTTFSATVCAGQNNVSYTVPNDPTVTYTWVYSGVGATITGTTNTITINFANNATSGTLSVTATNTCGTSAARTIAVTVNPLPAQPANFTTLSVVVCQGQNNVSYAVPNDPTITSYNWSYSGTGASIMPIGDSAVISFGATATSGTLSVTATNACGTSAARTLLITVNPLPNQPAAFTTSSATVCQGQNGVAYVVPFDPTVTYTWSYSGTGATINGTNNSVTVDFSTTATSGTLVVTAHNSCGASTPRTINITVNPLPAQPLPFAVATPTVCQGQTGVVYTVPLDVNATSYTWLYSGTGATITGTTNSVTIDYSNTATSGTLSVFANNACGASAVARTLAITVNPLPSQPGAFTGPTTVCQGQSLVPYKVVAAANAVSYTWTYSGTGATISQFGDSAVISFAVTATSGTLSVTATNACGTSTANTTNITVNPLPNQPAAFTASTAIVCQGQNGVVYTVPNDPTVTYNWSYTGSGATISGTGNSITINYGVTATSGTLSVTATNACGVSAARTISVTVNPLPASPVSFTTASPTVCQGQNNVAYSIPVDPNATSYTWTYTGLGATISGTTNSVTINFSNIATSGTLSVVGVNACGNSVTPLTLAITVNTLPTQPAPFTASSTTVCQGQDSVFYAVPNDPTATYVWSYSGVGATILNANLSNTYVNFANNATSGTMSVYAQNACGLSALARTVAVTVNPLPNQPAGYTTFSATVCQGQNNVIYTVPNDPTVTYTWTYTGTGATITPTGNSASVNFSAIATSGDIEVTASNSCGTSIARTVAVTVNPLPLQPAAFTTSSAVVCQGASASYAVPNDPTVTYTWTYTVGTGATITAFGDSAVFAFSNTATSGTVNVTATNSCGTSIARSMNVTVTPLPATPAAFTAGPATVCQGQTGVVYTVPNNPLVTYTWTYSGTGATINGTTNSVTVDFSNTATSGTLSVVATNACGTSTARTIAITVNPLPAQPAAFTTSSAVVCQGQTNVVYTVPNVAGITYTWTYTGGTGATIVGTTNSVTVNFSNTATSGTLNVTATNACGTSIARSIAITVNPLPNQPNGFTVFSAVVCRNQTGVVYTVPTDPTATSYTWTYSGTGATINGSGNSVTVDFGPTATSGNLSVVAVNSCGTSAARTIAITVNIPPAIATQPIDRTLCQGGNTTFTVAATGTAITYQWQVNDGTGWVDLTNTAPYSGVTTTTLAITTATYVMNGYQYRVVVSGACTPAATSNPATLTVNTAPTLVSMSPSTTVCEGANATFSITATGSGLTYVWQVDQGAGFVAVPAAAPYTGQNTATLTITGATAAMNGYIYRVIVTGTCAPAATSSNVTLTVNGVPTVTTPPADATTCAGSNAVFSVAATGAGLTYQWQVNDGTGFVNITPSAQYSGETTATLTVNSVLGSMNGYEYQVIISGTCPPPVTSAFATLTVNLTASWTGVISTDWSNPGNWSCNTLPTATTNVYIPNTAPNMPLVDITTAICDSILIDPTSSLAFTGTGNILEVKGSVTNNGTFDPSAGEVILSGTVNQFVPGATYRTLRVDGMLDKTIMGGSSITDSLVLNSGYLIIGNNNLTITTSASIIGGDSTSFIVTNGDGFVDNINIGFGGKTGNILYPVGAARNSYTPLRLANNGIADNFRVHVVEGIYTAYTNDIPTSLPLTDNAVAKSWIVQEGNPDGSNVALTLQWNSYDELPGFDRTACYLSHYIDPNWIPGLTGPAFGTGPFNVTLAGITTFSPFGVASAGSPLTVANTTKSETGIVLYPNPVSGDEMFVKFKETPKGEVSLRIVDVVGKTISEMSVAHVTNSVLPIKVSELPAGQYMLQLTDKNNKPIETIKFNKQ